MLQRDKLAEDNAVLTTNISSLFKTARMEVDRKTKEIGELRQKCASGSTMGQARERSCAYEARLCHHCFCQMR